MKKLIVILARVVIVAVICYLCVELRVTQVIEEPPTYRRKPNESVREYYATKASNERLIHEILKMTKIVKIETRISLPEFSQEELVHWIPRPRKDNPTFYLHKAKSTMLPGLSLKMAKIDRAIKICQEWLKKNPWVEDDSGVWDGHVDMTLAALEEAKVRILLSPTKSRLDLHLADKEVKRISKSAKMQGWRVIVEAP